MRACKTKYTMQQTFLFSLICAQSSNVVFANAIVMYDKTTNFVRRILRLSARHHDTPLYHCHLQISSHMRYLPALSDCSGDCDPSLLCISPVRALNCESKPTLVMDLR